MATLIALFNLADGADVEAYETFARERDVPTVSALASVTSFQVLKASGLLGGGAAPYRYVEVIEVPDLEAFGVEAAGDAVRAVVEEFGRFAADPVFLVTERIA